MRRETAAAEPTTVPSSPEAERATLGALMLSPQAVARLLPILLDDDFYYWQNQHVYNAIRDLHAQGRHVDPITVHGRLRQKGQLRFGDRDAGVYLADCIEAAYSPGFASDYADNVLESASRRRLLQAGLRVTQRASNPIGDTEELLNDAIRQFADVGTIIERRQELLSNSPPENCGIEL
jgi:replicative DNA helicase